MVKRVIVLYLLGAALFIAAFAYATVQRGYIALGGEVFMFFVPALLDSPVRNLKENIKNIRAFVGDRRNHNEQEC